MVRLGWLFVRRRQKRALGGPFSPVLESSSSFDAAMTWFGIVPILLDSHLVLIRALDTQLRSMRTPSHTLSTAAGSSPLLGFAPWR